MVTIILTTCDRPSMLARSVASVVRQSDPRWTLIIVDDGVSASAWETPHDPRIQSVRTPGHIGAAAARNIGMKLAKSEWVILLDDDDEMEAGHLSHFANTIARGEARPAFALTDWHVLDYREDGTVERERHRTYDMTPAPSPQNIHQALRAGACGLAVNQRALALAGPMDPAYRFTEDTEWILRLVDAGCDIRYVSGPGFVIHNHRSTGGLSGDQNLTDRIGECLALKGRYGDLGGRFPDLGLMFDGLIATYEARLADAGGAAPPE